MPSFLIEKLKTKIGSTRAWQSHALFLIEKVEEKTFLVGNIDSLFFSNKKQGEQSRP